MKHNKYFSIGFENDKFIFLDQTKLPFKEEYIKTDSVERIALAIERLEVRGAPAIGITAAYALALSLKNVPKKLLVDNFTKAYERLSSTRPTAVNLFSALDYIRRIFQDNINSNELYELLIQQAKLLQQEDIEKCDRIGINGLKIFQKKSIVLTHCNTGKLATAGDGTAFSVIKKGFEKGLVNYVYADETRPLLQGSRLTAFELDKCNIPFAILSDSMAAFLMQQNKVDLVITGADRIALNGDTANKIGTYNLAVLCNYHNIPFYIAAPTTTIDEKLPTGNDIKIEFRDKKELTIINGNPITLDRYDSVTPAFDVTPSYLIKGIITEENLYFFPYNFIR